MPFFLLQQYYLAPSENETALFHSARNLLVGGTRLKLALFDPDHLESKMARRFIKDLTPGQRIEDEVFLIRSKDLRTTTQGALYIHAVLVDRTGHLLSRMWQATESIYHTMPEGGFLRFKGRTENYKGNLQFIIDGIGLAEPGSFDISDFLPTTEKNMDEMWSRLVEILGEITHPHLKALVDEFLADQELMARFRRAPAAVTMHHAFIGGLLEHTLQLLELGTRVLPLYPKLSSDLVLTGLFLHDIGKAGELAYDTSIAYTDQGQLLGHIVQAVMWIDHKADAINARSGERFPDDLRFIVQHIVLSHHGSLEFGSPKLPAIPEAVFVHHLDNLDAKAAMFLNLIESDRDPASRWTNYHQMLQTKIYKHDAIGVRSDKKG